MACHPQSAWAVFGITIWISVYEMFAFTIQHAVRSHRVSWLHVRLPRAESFQKMSQQKKTTSQYPWRGEEIRDRDLRVETALSNLPCFALCRKTTANKQPLTKPYKMKPYELSPGYPEKVPTNPSLRKWNLFIYLCLYFCVLKTVFSFSYKFKKSINR